MQISVASVYGDKMRCSVITSLLWFLDSDSLDNY